MAAPGELASVAGPGSALLWLQAARKPGEPALAVQPREEEDREDTYRSTYFSRCAALADCLEYLHTVRAIAKGSLL
jgi:hypothetical protein